MSNGTKANGPVEKAPINLFDCSSQRRHWQFSREALDDVRLALNERAVKRVKLSHEEEQAGSTKQDTVDADDLDYLSAEDELSLIAFYISRLARVVKAFKFLGETVEATATTYLKRFYLSNTCMDYHPKLVMLTCVFLATKTENVPITIADFASKLKTDQADILGLEFTVSQALKFQYKVHHAHVAARGVGYDMQSTAVPLDRITKAQSAARDFIRGSRATDAEFLFTPSQIALAGYWVADSAAAETWLQAKRARLPEHNTDALATDALIGMLGEIRDLVQSKPPEPGKTEVPETIRDIDRRLQLCRNPEKNPESTVFRKRQAEADAVDREKRKKKMESAADSKDPFDSMPLPPLSEQPNRSPLAPPPPSR